MRTRSTRNLERSPRESRQQRRENRRVQNLQRQDQRPIAVVNENQDALHRLYTNVKSIPSYSSKIAAFLRQNETSSLHKQIRKKYIRRKIVSYYPYDVCMADVAFYNSRDYVKANNGYKYILVFIDVFTKMCYVEPLKNKTALTTLLALEKIIKRLPEIPHLFVTDDGTEFYNRPVRGLLEKYGIRHYSIRGEHKAAVAERMIRTMKGRLEKYMWHNKTKRYVDILGDIVNNYNRTPHRTIGMAPISVTLANREEVFKKMYPKHNLQTDTRLAVGDKVRITKLKTVFEKGYKRNWSIELYTIVSAKSSGGVDYYKIQDEDGNILPRQRYYYELNLVKKHDS